MNEKQAHGLLGAVTSNIDRLRQSIDALRLLHDQWRDNSGISINLIAQLTALKSNLREMQDWMHYALDDIHPQLLSDLDVLMTSCAMLVRNLDALTTQLRQPDHDQTDFAIRLKFVVGSRSMTRLRNVAKHQTDAVNLLLAACKCHTSAQRKILLHKSRQIRKEDASSLSTLVRTSRWNGHCINALTQLSRMLQFLRVLFYIKLFRRLPKEDTTEQDYLDAAALMRSNAIDHRLEEEAASLRHETKLVLIGDCNGSKELIMRQLQVQHGKGYQREERVQHRDAVRSIVRHLLQTMIGLLKEAGINLPRRLNEDFAILLHEIEVTDSKAVTPAAAHAVMNIWRSPEFSTLYLRNHEFYFPKYAAYFAQEVIRIAAEDFVPTDADLVRTLYPRGIQELRFRWDELDTHMFFISDSITHRLRRRWRNHFEAPTALIYAVDVSIYDHPSSNYGQESVLEVEFDCFEAIVNHPSFTGSSIMLLLNNFTRFREKLVYSPMETFFPDYKPPVANERTDANVETSARQYILRRFKDLNRNRLSIYSFWVDLDTGDNQHLYAALKKTLLHIEKRKARSEACDTSTAGGISRSGTLKGSSSEVSQGSRSLLHLRKQ